MPRKSNTRAAQGSGTIRQRPDGRWEARFFVNGQRKSVYGSTQGEVRKKLTAATSDVDNGQYIHPSQITLKEWSETWEKEYLTDVKASTRGVYHYDLEKYIVPALGRVKISALTAPAIQAYIISSPKTAYRQKLCGTFTAYCTAALLMLWPWAFFVPIQRTPASCQRKRYRSLPRLTKCKQRPFWRLSRGTAWRGFSMWPCSLAYGKGNCWASAGPVSTSRRARSPLTGSSKRRGTGAGHIAW